MSTVPEVLAAKASGMEVFAMSMVTNLAAGLADEELTHDAVKDVAGKMGAHFERVLRETLNLHDIAKDEESKEAKLLSELSLEEKKAMGSSAADDKGPTLKPFPESSWPVPAFAKWTPTANQIAEGARVLQQANTNEPAPSVAVFLTTGLATSWTNNITDVRSLSFADFVPLLRLARTRSGRFGHLLLGTTPGKQRIVLIANQALEGLTVSEASYIVQVLAAVGVRTVIQASVAVSPTNEKVDYVVFDDVLDRSCTRLPQLASSELGTRKYNQERFDDDILRKVLAARADNVRITAGTYLWYPGPSLPSPAEVSLATHLKCAAVGITSQAPLQVARQLGMKVHGIAVLEDSLLSGNLKLGSLIMKAPFVSDQLLKIIDDGHLPAAEVPFADLTRGLLREKFVYPPVHRAKQDSVLQVKDAAAFLDQHVLKEFGVSFRYTIMVEGAMHKVLSSLNTDLKVLKTVRAADYPDLVKAELGGPGRLGRRWKLSFALYKGVPVIIISASTKHHVEAPSFYKLRFAVRILKELGVKTLLLLAPVTAASDAHAVGDVVLVNDHVNLTGQSPLFGENHGEWGVRFPDMNNAYDIRLRQAAGGGPEGKMKETITAQVSNDEHDSHAEARLAAHLHCSTLSSGLPNITIVARHMKMEVFALGFVNRSVAPSTASSVLRPAAPMNDSSTEEASRAVKAVLDHLRERDEQFLKSQSASHGGESSSRPSN